MVMELFLQLGDDRGENMGCLGGLGAHDTEPFHVQQVAVDIGLLVEVESAGQVFQVRHVREVRLSEPQDREPAGYGVAADAAGNDLQGEVPGTPHQPSNPKSTRLNPTPTSIP